MAPAAFLLLASCFASALADAVQVNPPSSPPGDNVTAVYSNFFGISFELSFINYYLGNDTNSIPQPVLNYLGALHNRSSDRPLRLRLGGNSMDSSTYVPDQQQILVFTNPAANVNDQTVSFGSVLFDVMNTTGTMLGGIEWLIGLSLLDPNSTNVPLLAGDAQKYLGDGLDAYILGNEPDLYASHGDRPGMANYSVYDYVGDYWVATNNLENTPTDGNVLDLDKIAGPTICCDWDLNAVLTSGWLSDFQDRLKYITLQHYPQNNCFGSYQYHLDYYMSHTQTVVLAQWQQPGLQAIASTPSNQRKPVLMDEFNSASCGGVPESNMFGVGLWTADYALQMASVGYSGAYLHTREPGVSYNPLEPPAGDAGGAGAWGTNTNFYAMLAVTEALANANGSRVVDLGVDGSQSDFGAVHAGYAVYDQATARVHALALFNYANASAAATDFALPAALFDAAPLPAAVLVRYLSAPSATETTNVTWGNFTYAGVGDGTPVAAAAAAATQWTDRTYACDGGCTVQVPGPGMAVVFVGGAPSTTGAATAAANVTQSGGAAGPSSTGGSDGTNTTKTGAASEGCVANIWTLLAGLLLMTVM
ncbi:glycoside hydrolase family 79 protein [Phanerochaete carnosa HHB-10118-sp]|uniref:Glycoside hydrolase family 79 protein n=1 Tax=Phanerochaete carnosa (strain HHB-10118-sp) TaxID=650164 RepID=K5WL10_PHACS|nr:glycoside hydrolase family 79 protein [Phanerochaete carnosa HHB-10118-sp]EKM59829.1 glycoside hydrolase family 79 protein [Phanerochaete carnosa HHB-10118-sp]